MFRNSILGMLAAALLVQSSYGEELGGFGLTGLTPLADAEANAVRGEGMDSIALAASQIFVFDYVSGTSLNFQASSVNSNLNVNLDVTETLEDSSGASISTISSTRIGAFEIGIDDFLFFTEMVNIDAFGSPGVGMQLHIQ
ncbi:hypothetical protein N9250_00265 [bacterium]|nr:hypothetical protein [Rubripirellula sp.]MDA7874617.1 hypothetical protein [Rhodopirellula sp.]MDB4540096.1 hypothetical protein [bacterium]MDB4644945.1 hypothetical protein [Rubripirellula sp.]